MKKQIIHKISLFLMEYNAIVNCFGFFLSNPHQGKFHSHTHTSTHMHT